MAKLAESLSNKDMLRGSDQNMEDKEERMEKESQTCVANFWDEKVR